LSKISSGKVNSESDSDENSFEMKIHEFRNKGEGSFLVFVEGLSMYPLFEFLDNVEKLENFPMLENLNIFFSQVSDYNSLKQSLPLHLNNVKIYLFAHSFPYLSQVN
jgi:hypothetical protein